MLHITKMVDNLSRLGERLTPYKGEKYLYSVKGKIVARGATTDLKKREAELQKKWPTGRIIPLKDAYIRFNPNNGEVLESRHTRNIAALTDSGQLDFTVIFDTDFPEADYEFEIGADADVHAEVLDQSVGSIRFKFKEPCPDTVDITFH